jgi:two-component system, OmpR family, sensor kinase
VTIDATRRDGAVELSVSDRGRGLEPAAVDRVFDRFYTSDSSRGSGLGLAIARELAERMDGRIGLASGPGRTVFTLVLPAPRDRNGHRRDERVLEGAVPGGVGSGPE